MPAKTRRSLARRMLRLQLAVVALTVAIGAVVTVSAVRQQTEDRSRERVLMVAQTLAQTPTVLAALDDADPARILQPLAERVRKRTGVAFVVIMSPRRIRYSHPNPARIGGRFLGKIAPALRGRSFTETYTGTLGRSVRSVAPVTSDGRVIGLVSAGVLRGEVSGALARRLPQLLALAALALVAGSLLSLLLARRVKRQTLGLEPDEIAALYEHHDAVLHAIREGVLAIDGDGRLRLANDEARRLLDLPQDAEGAAVERWLAAGPLRELLAAGRPAQDEVVLVGDRVLVVSQRTATVDGRSVGSVATLRDRTELQSLLRELDTVRSLADSLRAQAHESANQLHTLVGLVELGRYDEAVRFATERVELAQDLLHRLQERVEEPALVALLLGKTAVARERGIELRLAEHTSLAGTALPPTDLVTIVGNLLDNAFDAVTHATEPPWVEISLHSEPGFAVIEVRDNGPGLPAGGEERVFEAGWTTKHAEDAAGHGLGLALVRQAVTALGGTVTARTEGGAVFTVRLPVRSTERLAASGAV